MVEAAAQGHNSRLKDQRCCHTVVIVDPENFHRWFNVNVAAGVT